MCIELAEKFLLDKRKIDKETGEIFQNYPTDFKDSEKKRRNAAILKISNPNSYSSRIFDLLGEEAYWYTLDLGDIYPSWAKYETLLDPALMKKIKRHVGKHIKGPFQATGEMCAFTGSHVHIIAGKQSYKHLKAETKIYDQFGLLEYTSKSSFAIKDKYSNPEEYQVMLGTWVHWKGMMGHKPLPKRSWTRLKA